jgi:hypothetical protein
VASGRRRALGAEELIELGQAQTPSLLTPTQAPAQTVVLTAAEGKLVVGVVENLVSFANNYSVEYQAYCPPDLWKKSMEEIGTWSHEIDLKLKARATQVTVPAEMIFRLVDLEKCVSAARDARLSSSRWAFTLSAVGAIADFALGITWLGVPMYIAGLGLLFGRPLYAKYQATPEEPFAPSIAGRKACLSGECELIAMKMKKEAAGNPMKRQVLERVIVPRTRDLQVHHWGTVAPGPGPQESSVCLSKDRFRIRVEGWVGDVVTPTPEWRRTTNGDCAGDINICVFDPQSIRQTLWGPMNVDSGHDGSYWVEYAGPLTKGRVRRAGPFGCTGDPVDHAMEDAGFSKAGVDGGYVIFDKAGNVVKEETL